MRISKNYNVVVLRDKIYIEDVKINLEKYDAKILAFEYIDGFVKCDEIDKDYMTFKKDGQTLSEYFKDNKLSANDIIGFIEDIYKAVSSIENYLVSENTMLMDLDAIIINNNHHLEFLAVPDVEQDFILELSRFLVRILRFTDVKDKMALSLAYKLFIRSSKDNYTIEDLLEAVEEVKYSKNI